MSNAYSNFVLTKTEGSNPVNWVFFAEIDITTTKGFLWWEKTTTARHKIRRVFGGSWHFVATGEFCSSQIETLARAFTAQTGKQV